MRLKHWTPTENEHEYECETIHLIIFRKRRGQWTFRSRYKVPCNKQEGKDIVESPFIWASSRAVRRYIHSLPRENALVLMSTPQIIYEPYIFNGIDIEYVTDADLIDELLATDTRRHQN